MEKKSDLKELGIAAASLLIGIATKEVLKYSWTKIKGTPPPENPNDNDTETSEAVLWTVGLAVFSGLVKLAFDTTIQNKIEDNSNPILIK